MTMPLLSALFALQVVLPAGSPAPKPRSLRAPTRWSPSVTLNRESLLAGSRLSWRQGSDVYSKDLADPEAPAEILGGYAWGDVELWGTPSSVVFLGQESWSEDLNGDGDTLDFVPVVYVDGQGDRGPGVASASTTTLPRSGIRSLADDGKLLLFYVDEAADGRDWNGNGLSEILPAVWSVPEQELTVLPHAAPSNPFFLQMESDGRFVFAIVEETNDDLNQDGDTNDQVIWAHDLQAGTGTSLGLAVTSSSLRLSNDLLVFGASELAQGIDLTGDGLIASQNVLHVYDPSAGLVTNVGLDAKTVMEPDGPRLPFSVNEDAHGDLNGDGDVSDDVWHVLDLDTGGLQNLGYPDSSSFRAVVEASHLVDVVWEGFQGVDLTNDGDLDDFVLVLMDLELGTAFNTAVRSTTRAVPGGGRVLYEVVERFGVDLNGDGDFDDTVWHAIELASKTTTNLGWIGIVSQLEGDRAIFQLFERENGLGDLNGDGDTDDMILHVRDLADDSFFSLDTAGYVPFPAAGGGATLPVLVWESLEGRDLNGDGDQGDTVLHLWQTSTRFLTNLRVGLVQELWSNSGWLVYGANESADSRDYDRNGSVQLLNVLHAVRQPKR